MDEKIYKEGVKYLHSIEPKFKKITPKNDINFFIRPEGFYGIMSLIIEQQISVQAAEAIKQKVLKLIRSAQPKNFLSFEDDDLRAVGLSMPKISYLKDIARLELEGSLSYVDLKEMDDDLAREYLMRIRGIGKWTADCYLMASLGRPDIWPENDIGLQEGVRRLKDLKERPSIEDMTSIARDWRPFRSVAANLIWADYD